MAFVACVSHVGVEQCDKLIPLSVDLSKILCVAFYSTLSLYSRNVLAVVLS